MTNATWKRIGKRVLHIMVDWQGYHLHGEVLEANRAVLSIGKSVRYDIPVFLVFDPDTGEKFAIPVEHGILMTDPPIIDLKGRLHGGAVLDTG